MSIHFYCGHRSFGIRNWMLPRDSLWQEMKRPGDAQTSRADGQSLSRRNQHHAQYSPRCRRGDHLMAVTKRLRFEILRRDNHRCRYCGATPLETELQIDHVIPRSLGGTDEPSNLFTSCADCNRGKASIAPEAQQVEDVKEDALRWARAMNIAGQVRREEWQATDDLVQAFEYEWERYNYTGPGCTAAGKVARDVGFATSIERFLDAGLSFDDLLRFMRAAMTNPSAYIWKSFCKKCWEEIRLRQDVASHLVTTGAC